MKRAVNSVLVAILVLAPALAAAKAGHSARAPQTAAPVERSARADKASTDRADKSDKDDGDAPTTTTAGKTADGKTIKTKTYTFGAMYVEGKLKTPQLLYFLNRVKLELDMSAPDKRSFMKELVKSADDKSL
jgi:hypothetical protein